MNDDKPMALRIGFLHIVEPSPIYVSHERNYHMDSYHELYDTNDTLRKERADIIANITQRLTQCLDKQKDKTEWIESGQCWLEYVRIVRSLFHNSYFDYTDQFDQAFFDVVE